MRLHTQPCTYGRKRVPLKKKKLYAACRCRSIRLHGGAEMSRRRLVLFIAPRRFIAILQFVTRCTTFFFFQLRFVPNVAFFCSTTTTKKKMTKRGIIVRSTRLFYTRQRPNKMRQVWYFYIKATRVRRKKGAWLSSGDDEPFSRETYDQDTRAG